MKASYIGCNATDVHKTLSELRPRGSIGHSSLNRRINKVKEVVETNPQSRECVLRLREHACGDRFDVPIICLPGYIGYQRYQGVQSGIEVLHREHAQMKLLIVRESRVLE